MFAKYDYLATDCLRKRYWENKGVTYWYSKSMILYVYKDTLRNDIILSKLYEESDKEILPLVHPINFIGKAKVWNIVWNLVPNFLKIPAKKIFWKNI